MAQENYIPIEIDIDFTKSKTAQADFIREMGKLKQSMLDIREENKKLNKEYKEVANDASLSTSEQIQKRKQLSEQISKNEIDLKKLTKAQRDTSTAYKAVDKGVNAYERQSAELTTLRKKIRAIQAEGGIVSKEDLARADELDDKLKGIDGGLGQFFRNIGNYSSAFDGILGNIGGGKGGGIGDLLGQFKGLVNPITVAGTALVALTGYVAGVTLEYEKLQNTVTKATGLQGEQARVVTANVKAISDTFDQDFNEVTIATNAFAKQMGISFEEAFGLVEKGFLNGADAQGDFLDSLKEYPAFIKNANLSAEDFIELQIRGQREGIFSDKLIDAIKEADLSLKEFTKTQRDALLPLGQQFADELEKGLASGEITTVEALTRIQKRAKEVGLNLRDTATITADIFKGAGEDAGGAAKVLEIVYATLEGSLDDLSIAGDAYNERQKLIYDASLNLALAESELSSKFAGLGGTFAGSGDTIKAFFINILNDAIDTIAETSRQIGALWAGAKQLFSNIKNLDFSKSVSDAVNESYVASIKRSNDAIKEHKESTRELTEEEKKLAAEKERSAIRTRLQSEQAAKESAARLQKIKDIRTEIQDLKDAIDFLPDEKKFDIVTNISKLENQLRALGADVGDAIAGGIAPTLPTLDLIPDQIDSIKAVNKAKEDEDKKFLKGAKERIKEFLVNYKADSIATEEELAKLKKALQEQAISRSLDSLNNLATIADNKGQSEIASLEEKYGKEIALAEGNTKEQERLQKELDRKKRKIDEEAFERSKRFQLLEATINFEKGLTNILSLAGTDVFSTPILKGIQIAALIAQYTTSVAAIASAKFAKGTVLKGASHDKGGIQLFGKSGQHFGEAEGGEPILTKGTSGNSKTLGVLSYINKKYGGYDLGGSSMPEDLRKALDVYMSAGITNGFRAPAPPLRVYAKGGVVQAQTIQAIPSISPDDIADAVVAAIKGVTIVTDIRDIVEGTDKYNTVLNSAKIA